MKSKLRFSFVDEVEEKLPPEQSVISEKNEEKKQGKLDTNPVNLVFVDIEEVDKVSSKIMEASQEDSQRFVGNLFSKSLAPKKEIDIKDVESAFSSIDKTIEEQYQRAREKARLEAGVDPKIKQQQRMIIESEFRERRRKRLEVQKRKADKELHIYEPIEEKSLEIEQVMELEQPAAVKLDTIVNETIPLPEVKADIILEPKQEMELKKVTEPEGITLTVTEKSIKEEPELQAPPELEVYYPELLILENEGEALEEPKSEFTSTYLNKKIDGIFSGCEKVGEKIKIRVDKVSMASAKGVERVDDFVLTIETKVERKGTSIKRTIFSIEHYFEKRKKQVAFTGAVSIVGILIVTFAIGNFTAYEYMYNGKVLGVVKNQEEVFKTIDVIGDKLVYEHNAEIKIDKEKDITFNRILAAGQDLDDKEDILNRLTYMKDINAKGYAIMINGLQTTVLANEEEAQNILERVKNQFSKQNEETGLNVSFEEAVLIKSVETKLGSIMSEEKAATKLMGATTHKAEGASKALLNIQTEEVLTYTESISFAIAYEDTDTKFTGESSIKSKGVEGQKQVIAKVVKTNGEEVEREILEEAVISAPIAQVVERGTKPPPKLEGTGTFIWPIRGTITSRFGYRWGTTHNALDVAAPTGTPIIASDGGTVTFAGNRGTYGLLVEIDHGGNRVTRYAHCNEIWVKVGQKVFQGMHIADVGNTGFSTGPHLHLEILINGVQKNPLNYLE